MAPRLFCVIISSDPTTTCENLADTTTVCVTPGNPSHVTISVSATILVKVSVYLTHLTLDDTSHMKVSVYLTLNDTSDMNVSVYLTLDATVADAGLWSLWKRFGLTVVSRLVLSDLCVY